MKAIRQKKYKVVLDAINSTGALFIPPLLKELGVEESSRPVFGSNVGTVKNVLLPSGATMTVTPGESLGALVPSPS